MSRARKIKKWNRFFEYQLEFINTSIWYHGPDEAHSRRSRMRDIQREGGGWPIMHHAPVKHRR